MWNESRCPNGFVRKDYKDNSRLDNIETSPKLKAIASEEAVLYNCPFAEQDVLVVKKGLLDVKVGDTISSQQAGGIFNKVTEVANHGRTLPYDSQFPQKSDTITGGPKSTPFSLSITFKV